MLPIEEFAKNVSHHLHRNQRRNDAVTPYKVHTDYVGDNAPRFLRTVFEDIQISPRTIARAKAIGYLHDAIEDQTCERDLLAMGKEYDDWPFVVRCVVTLSRMSKETPILQYLDGIRNNAYCICVKLADLEHNMSDLKAGNLRDKYELCRAYLMRGLDEVDPY